MVDNQPTPLLWAVGLTAPEDLEAYAGTGFNTVEIVVSAGGEGFWQAAQGLAGAAAERGMLVLLTIIPPADLGGVAPSPFDEAYQQAVADYLAPIVQRGLELPGLVGWVVEAVDCEAMRFSEADFRRYLERWHGSLRGALGAWGAESDHQTALTEALVVELDSRRPLGLGRASVDLARYRAQVYGEVLDLWAQEIRRRDRQRVVLAGRQYSYRAAISVPESFDGMLLGLYPGVAEEDPATHNVHGIDIARRGNQFAALPVLKVKSAESDAQLGSWAAQAVLHGAAGIGFADWKQVREHQQVRDRLRGLLTAIRQARLCPRVPAAAGALLYQPYAAGGFASGRPLYGWLTGVSALEPGGLFRALARGSAFGQIDYLAESSLLSVPLDRYACIVAPLALSLPPQHQAALAGYVERGGTLLADLGAGFAQSGQLEYLPETLADLFGVRPLQQGGAAHIQANLLAAAPHPRFPSLQREMSTAQDPHPASFDPPLYFMVPAQGAAPLLAQWAGVPAFAGIMARGVGEGWALYATLRLWHDWLPGNPAFDAFHGDLLGLDSLIAIKQPPGRFGGDDIAAFQDGSIMLLKGSAGATEVLVRNPTGRVYQIWGGVQEIRSPEVSANSLLKFARPGLQVAEPLPLQIATDAPRLTVQMITYSPQEVSFGLYGPATQFAPRREAEPVVRAAGEGAAHVRISRGDYPIPRRSRHQVAIRGLKETEWQMQVVAADAQGVVAFDAPANCIITIKRLAGLAPEDESEEE